MTLYCKAMGEGHAVILLHGLFGMADNLTALGNALSDNYHVLMPDAVNHGRSPHRFAADYPSMAADVMKVLDCHGHEKAAVVGHSMGGKIAMQMALDYPARIACLVAADIAPVAYQGHHQAVFAALQRVADAKPASRSEADELMAQHVDEPMVRQFLLKSLKKAIDGSWQWQLGLDEIVDSYPLINAAPVMQRPYDGPALFIRGAESDYISASAEPEIRRYFPAAELATLEGTGHWLHAEKPGPFNLLVKQFLEAHYVQG